MTMGYDCQQLKAMLQSDFAPWIQQLALEPLLITETGAKFQVPENSEITRKPDIICGQAVASIADTASVLTLYGHNQTPRPLTTVDLNVQFLRPLFLGPMFAETFIQSNGKRMASVRVEFKPKEDQAKVAASATCMFAYL